MEIRANRKKFTTAWNEAVAALAQTGGNFRFSQTKQRSCDDISRRDMQLKPRSFECRQLLFCLAKRTRLEVGAFPLATEKRNLTSLGPEEPTTGAGLFISVGPGATIAVIAAARASAARLTASSAADA